MTRQIALLLLLLTFITRLPAFVYPILDEDEAIHAAIATEIAHGGLPYVDAVDNKTPLLWYTYAGVFIIFGDGNMLAVHVFTALVIFATALIIFACANILQQLYGLTDFMREHFSPGMVAALSYIIFSTASFYKILASNFELHLLFFEALAILAGISAVKQADILKRFSLIFIAGMIIGFSFLTKQQGGMLLASLPLGLLALEFPVTLKKLFTEHLLRVIFLTAGFLAVLFVFTLYAKHDGFYDEMLYWTTAHAHGYITSGFSAIAGAKGTLWRISTWIIATFPLWFLTWRAMRTLPDNKTCRFSLVLLFCSFIPVAMGGRFFAHYFLLTLPGLSLTAASIFPQLAIKARRAVTITTGIIAVLFLAASLSKPLIEKHIENKVVVDYVAAGKKIAEITNPDDKIFVWGWSPEFYRTSGRRPASRFVFCDALSGRIPGISAKSDHTHDYQKHIDPRAWDLLWQDFLVRPPKIIIDAAAINLHDYASYPMKNYRLKDLVDKYYDPLELGPLQAYYLRSDIQ